MPNQIIHGINFQVQVWIRRPRIHVSINRKYRKIIQDHQLIRTTFLAIRIAIKRRAPGITYQYSHRQPQIPEEYHNIHNILNIPNIHRHPIIHRHRSVNHRSSPRFHLHSGIHRLKYQPIGQHRNQAFWINFYIINRVERVLPPNIFRPISSFMSLAHL